MRPRGFVGGYQCSEKYASFIFILKTFLRKVFITTYQPDNPEDQNINNHRRVDITSQWMLVQFVMRLHFRIISPGFATDEQLAKYLPKKLIRKFKYRQCL
jgi:hypothetical protein